LDNNAYKLELVTKEQNKTTTATKVAGQATTHAVTSGANATVNATSQGSKAVAGTVSRNTSVVQDGFNNVTSSLGNLASSISSMSMGGGGDAGGGMGGGGAFDVGGGGGSPGQTGSMVALAQGAGFTGRNAQIMGAIAMAESSGNARAHNTNAGTGDNSYGLWQINMLGAQGPERQRQMGLKSYDDLFNPQTNARAAMSVYKSQGFGAWSTYKDGSYKKYMASAMAPNLMGAGGGMGSLGGAQALAKRDGLAMTSYRGGQHANGSLHYQGRAMDFGGDPGEMRTFANQLKSTRPTELIHNPNASMKNGQSVSPSYWGPETWAAHANHVHVGYAYGAGNPAFFSSLSGARAWEKKMSPTNASIASVTSNSSEFGGGPNITNSITINQQPNQDPNHLASIVVQKMGEWVSEARSSSLFV